LKISGFFEASVAAPGFPRGNGRTMSAAGGCLSVWANGHGLPGARRGGLAGVPVWRSSGSLDHLGNADRVVRERTFPNGGGFNANVALQ
jgi:hypothetical protein